MITRRRNTTFGEKYKAIKIDRGVELPGFGVTSKDRVKIAKNNSEEKWLSGR